MDQGPSFSPDSETLRVLHVALATSSLLLCVDFTSARGETQAAACLVDLFAGDEPVIHAPVPGAYDQTLTAGRNLGQRVFFDEVQKVLPPGRAVTPLIWALHRRTASGGPVPEAGFARRLAEVMGAAGPLDLQDLLRLVPTYAPGSGLARWIERELSSSLADRGPLVREAKRLGLPPGPAVLAMASLLCGAVVALAPSVGLTLPAAGQPIFDRRRAPRSPGPALRAVAAVLPRPAPDVHPTTPSVTTRPIPTVRDIPSGLPSTPELFGDGTGLPGPIRRSGEVDSSSPVRIAPPLGAQPLAQPLPFAEVFGYAPNDMSEDARGARSSHRCPFLDVPCTKNSKRNPLGVCSVWYGGKIVTTCPSRFHQDKLVETVVRSQCFSPGEPVHMFSEARLADANSNAVGNIDFVAQSESTPDDVVFVEVQAVYCSGCVQKPFDWYMKDPESAVEKGWPTASWPKPDFLSSSKRLMAQLMTKGHIVSKGWGKFQVVVVDLPYFASMPVLPTVSAEEANLIWFLFHIDDRPLGQRQLRFDRAVYTDLDAVIKVLSEPPIGAFAAFLRELERKAGGGKKRPKSSK